MINIAAFYGAFTEEINMQGISIMIMIFPEMVPSEQSIKFSGRYFIYGNHPKQGSFNMIVEQSALGHWVCKHQPQLINSESIKIIGKSILESSKSN